MATPQLPSCWILSRKAALMQAAVSSQIHSSSSFTPLALHHSWAAPSSPQCLPLRRPSLRLRPTSIRLITLLFKLKSPTNRGTVSSAKEIDSSKSCQAATTVLWNASFCQHRVWKTSDMAMSTYLTVLVIDEKRSP